MRAIRKNRLSLSVVVFGGIALVFLALQAFTTVSNALSDKARLRRNALTQGYWIARSLEIGHSMMMQDHTNALRDILTEIETNPDIRFLIVLDASQQVLIASDPTREGTHWPRDVGQPPETGRIMQSDTHTIELVFPAFFVRTFRRMQHYHPHVQSSLDRAAWILLGLDVSDDLAHYRASVIQSVFVAISVVILGLAAFVFFGIIQRYQLASASLAQLEKIKHHLARFVPGTVQELIEENPEQPLLDKVEHEATILFLDINHYTTIAADMSPAVLNRLIERYFSAFLDIILTHGGEINETAGDAIMAIFTGQTPRLHAHNAVNAAVAMRAKAAALNREAPPHEPEILVNIGINTGQVLLGATMIRGAAGEHFTYTASGMVTNIVARLCDLGSHGEIHLSNTTAEWVRDYVTLRGPRKVHLKNIRGTMSVYKLV